MLSNNVVHERLIDVTEIDIEALRVAIYRNFANRGESGRSVELADELGTNVETIQISLRQLANERHIVLDEAGRIIMAHPFSSIPLGFSVMGLRMLWWGGCAWDSFALPHILPNDNEVLVATRCPNCERVLAWAVNNRKPPDGAQVAHFLTPAAQLWDNVVHSCANQRIFCSEECVHTWLTATGQNLGYIMDLSTLWHLASHWYEGRLDYGYVRRDPAAATAYFLGVGLNGPFWNTPSPTR